MNRLLREIKRLEQQFNNKYYKQSLLQMQIILI